MYLKRCFSSLAGILLSLLPLSPVFAATTLETVLERGYIRCGVSTGVPGFSVPDPSGQWQGFDVDFCRAVAAATLGSDQKVRYIPLTVKERFPALRDGTIDVLFRNSTLTIARDTTLGLSFAGITYFDGQGFLVRNSKKITSATELDRVSVCVKEGTTNQINLEDFFDQHDNSYSPVVVDTTQALIRAFDTGKCDVLSSDRSQLWGIRSRLSDPGSATLLSDIISKEPLGPAVREDDLQWLRIVKWVLAVMINGEELDIGSYNIMQQRSTSEPDIRHLLSPDIPETLGLESQSALLVLQQVGHYGEVYARNLGADSSLNIERGLNNLWSWGGILYAPPTH